MLVQLNRAVTHQSVFSDEALDHRNREVCGRRLRSYSADPLRHEILGGDGVRCEHSHRVLRRCQIVTVVRRPRCGDRSRIQAVQMIQRF